MGFLVIYHRYQVIFDLPKSLLPNSENVTQKDTEPPNINCRLAETNKSVYKGSLIL